MMKWLGLVGGALLVLCAVVWFFNRPTYLTVQVVLAETNVDVTDHVYVAVGPLREGVTSDPTLADLRHISDSFDVPNRYRIPHGVPINAFATPRFLEPIEAVITVPRGQHAVMSIPIDAALVEAEMLWDDIDVHAHPSLSLGEKFNGTSSEFSAEGRLSLLLPPGPHRLIANHGFTDDIKDIDATAGQVLQHRFDARLSDVTVSLAAGTLDMALLPPMFVVFEGDEGQRFRANIDSSGMGLAKGVRYGTYMANLSFEYQAENNTNVQAVALGPVTVNAPTTEVGHDLQFMSVIADLSGLLAEDRAELFALLFAQTGGSFYARAPIINDRTQMVFEPRSDTPGDVTYLLAIRSGNEIVSLHDIGRPDGVTPTLVTVPPGGDAALCQRIFPEGHCDRLTDG